MKLHGLKVVDLSSFVPGPYLTMLLADHGAEVVKIEAPGEGDPYRHVGLSDGPSTVVFRNLNRGKKSVVLDLKADAGRHGLLALVRNADVFVESFRPGVAGRLGIDYNSLRAVNPALVYCSISAFGQDGPLSRRPAHDLAVEAIAGALSIQVSDDGAVALPGIPAADILGALHGVAGILMALYRRQQTGVGDYIDIAMLDCTVSALRHVLGPTLAQGRQPEPGHERTTGGSAFYRLYATRDGRAIALAGQEAKFIRALLNDLGRPDLIAPCLQGPGVHQRPVMAFLEQMFGLHTCAEWEERLTRLGVCYGAVNTLPEAIDEAQLQAREMLIRDDIGRVHIASPIRFRQERANPSYAEPVLDAHRGLFRAELES